MGDMELMLNIIGHIGYMLLFGGQALIAMGNGFGWPVRLAGEAVWFCLGIKMRMNSIWMWGTIGIVIETMGMLHWLGVMG
jgi:hypothetical protein